MTISAAVTVSGLRSVLFMALGLACLLLPVMAGRVPAIHDFC
jgi:hypothetical protein